MTGIAGNFVTTSSFKEGFTWAVAVTDKNLITAFDGLPGTGKTTCARKVAEHLDRPSAIATMTHRPSGLELLRRIYMEVTHEKPVGTRFDLQNDLKEILADWGGVLIIDELQNSQENVMQELVWLHEETKQTFGIVVVGTGVIEASKRHPQLETRIVSPTTFASLQGEELISTVRHLDERFEGLSKLLIRSHDSICCNGNLRRWGNTIRLMDAFELTTVGTAELKVIAERMPKEEK